jgi:phage host-nuclease inhibitor protein Gam
MAKKKPKLEVTDFNTPTNTLEAAEYERLIGALLGNIESEEIALAAAKAKLDEEAEKRLSPMRAEVLGRSQALHRFADHNRHSLTHDGKVKTVVLEHAGDIRWYETPGRVVFTRKTDAIVAAIKRLKLVKLFTRKVWVLNKAAMLEHPDLARKVSGVTIVSGEKFAIRPAGMKRRVERDAGGSWSITITDKEDIEE